MKDWSFVLITEQLEAGGGFVPLSVHSYLFSEGLLYPHLRPASESLVTAWELQIFMFCSSTDSYPTQASGTDITKF